MTRKRGLSSDQKAAIRQAAAEFTGSLYFDTAIEKLMSFLRGRGVIGWDVKPGQVVRIVRGRTRLHKNNKRGGLCHRCHAPIMRDRGHPLPQAR